MQPNAMFEWRVPGGGFRIESGRLIPSAERGETPDRVYRPFVEEPALFRVFTDLPHPLTEEAVLGFAERYGPLGVDGGDGADAGEAVAEWQLEHEAMGDAVELMEALTADKRSEPRETVERLAPDKRSRLSVEARLRSELVPGQRRGSRSQWRLEAQVLLAELVEPRLEEEAATRFRLQPGRPPMLVAQPRGLLGALWIQVATAVAEERTFQRCEGCGKWLDTSPAAGRTDRRYCDTACRMRAYRGRRGAVGR